MCYHMWSFPSSSAETFRKIEAQRLVLLKSLPKDLKGSALPSELVGDIA